MLVEKKMIIMHQMLWSNEKNHEQNENFEAWGRGGGIEWGKGGGGAEGLLCITPHYRSAQHYQNTGKLSSQVSAVQ